MILLFDAGIDPYTVTVFNFVNSFLFLGCLHSLISSELLLSVTSDLLGPFICFEVRYTKVVKFSSVTK